MLEISEKLQNQVRFFCDRISKVEWSGVLFYTTSGGNFGDPTFRVVAEEVYLMDIDTPVFTSYKFDGAFVKMLMENPRLRAMKVGHCHSHQNFGVFFSGTDTTEIMDNSAHHNYYLSLIVNNINEMTAKVAFRVHRTSTHTNELKYNDLNGVPVITTDYDVKKQESVFIYDCNIIKPHIPDAFTRDRYKEIRGIKKAENDLLQAEAERIRLLKTAAVMPKDYSYLSHHPSKAVKSAMNLKDIQQEMRMGNLFDSTTPEGKIPVGSAIDGSIREWMIDILGRGVKNQLLSQVLGNIAKRINGGSNFNTKVFLDDVFGETFVTYYNAFPDDPTYKEFDSRVKAACNMLNFNYSEKYPILVTKIINKLKSIVL